MTDTIDPKFRFLNPLYLYYYSQRKRKAEANNELASVDDLKETTPPEELSQHSANNAVSSNEERSAADTPPYSFSRLIIQNKDLTVTFEDAKEIPVKEVIDIYEKVKDLGLTSVPDDKASEMVSSPKVFISYARKDLKFAEKVASTLGANGFDVWFDQTSLRVGDRWEDEIEKAMDDSDFVVILISKNSVKKKGFFAKEVRMALDRQLETPLGSSEAYVLPIIIDGISIPSEIRHLHCPNISKDIEGGLQRLTDSINYHYQEKIKNLKYL